MAQKRTFNRDFRIKKISDGKTVFLKPSCMLKPNSETLFYMLKPPGSNQVVTDFSRSVEGPDASHEQVFFHFSAPAQRLILLLHYYAQDNAGIMCKTLPST